MASLIDHIALMRNYKAHCEKEVSSEKPMPTDKIAAFFADQFAKEAGGAFWRHLEEIAALIPDQAALAEATEECAAAQAEVLPLMRLADRMFENVKRSD